VSSWAGESLNCCNIFIEGLSLIPNVRRCAMRSSCSATHRSPARISAMTTSSSKTFGTVDIPKDNDLSGVRFRTCG